MINNILSNEFQFTTIEKVIELIKIFGVIMYCLSPVFIIIVVIYSIYLIRLNSKKKKEQQDKKKKQQNKEKQTANKEVRHK